MHFPISNIAKVQPVQSPSNSELLMNCFVFSHLDYCNYLLPCLGQAALARLQLVQNAAASLLIRSRHSCHLQPYVLPKG